MRRYKEWKETFQMKKKYSKNRPYCFYDLAEKYLPENKEAVIIDVGCGGYCKFENYLELWDKYRTLILLDGNEDTVDTLRRKYNNVVRYTAPNRIPLEDNTIDFIYCSHMIEHLYPIDVYSLLKEFNRILKPQGIIVIRSPMIDVEFYNTMDHIRPYPPSVFPYFLCGGDTEDTSYRPISKDYKVEELVYRYHTHSTPNNRLGSSIKLIDFLIHGTGRITRILRIRRYRQTGYTIVLRKEK